MFVSKKDMNELTQTIAKTSALMAVSYIEGGVPPVIVAEAMTRFGNDTVNLSAEDLIKLKIARGF